MSPDLRERLCLWARSLFERGYTAGSSGNISVRTEAGYLVTPTNSCLGFLDPQGLSELDAAGRLVAGPPPTKEVPMHLAMYRARPEAGAVVHLHSTFATALSCLAGTDPDDAIPALTPYVVMRVGRVPLVPYHRPGDAAIAGCIAAAARTAAAVLIANHGPVVSGASLEAAVFAAEELEETAKLALLTRGMNARALGPEEIAALAGR